MISKLIKNQIDNIFTAEIKKQIPIPIDVMIKTAKMKRFSSFVKCFGRS